MNTDMLICQRWIDDKRTAIKMKMIRNSRSFPKIHTQQQPKQVSPKINQINPPRWRNTTQLREQVAERAQNLHCRRALTMQQNPAPAIKRKTGGLASKERLQGPGNVAATGNPATLRKHQNRWRKERAKVVNNKEVERRKVFKHSSEVSGFPDGEGDFG